jgi:hypothetical protein
MSGSSQKIAAIILGALLGLVMGMALTGSAYAAQQHSPRKRLVKQEPPAPAPQPLPDPPPLTLEQKPASAPQVSFQNGQLTIVAPNSTLGDILRAVRSQTGASVEIPGNATERVVARLGPGLARDVLASLLNGSHFNYVMLGSATDPSQVERIILTSKAGSAPIGSDAASQPATSQAQGILQQTAEVPEEMQGEEAADDSGDADNQADNQANQADVPQAGQPNGQSPIKTPEQLLQELQRQQQIQQQQQQQQPQPGVPQTLPIPRTQPPQPQ